MQTITICTDAGHKLWYKGYVKQDCAIWACYIRTPSQTIKSSGIIKQDCKGSSQAELYAIANAFHIVCKRYDLSKYKIIVYSDSLYALANHFDWGKKFQKPDRVAVYDKYIRPCIEKAAVYEARHVKAHLDKSQWGTSSARFFMQNWCDEEVHRLMPIAVRMEDEKLQKELVFLAQKEHN